MEETPGPNKHSVFFMQLEAVLGIAWQRVTEHRSPKPIRSIENNPRSNPIRDKALLLIKGRGVSLKGRSCLGTGLVTNRSVHEFWPQVSLEECGICWDCGFAYSPGYLLSKYPSWPKESSLF